MLSLASAGRDGTFQAKPAVNRRCQFCCQMKAASIALLVNSVLGLGTKAGICNPGMRMYCLRHRFREVSKTADQRQKDDAAAMQGAEPGVLGPELREALGLGPLDPPPWLTTMHRLGIPPGVLARPTALAQTCSLLDCLVLCAC